MQTFTEIIAILERALQNSKTNINDVVYRHQRSLRSKHEGGTPKSVK